MFFWWKICFIAETIRKSKNFNQVLVCCMLLVILSQPHAFSWWSSLIMWTVFLTLNRRLVLADEGEYHKGWALFFTGLVIKSFSQISHQCSTIFSHHLGPSHQFLGSGVGKIDSVFSDSYKLSKENSLYPLSKLNLLGGNFLYPAELFVDVLMPQMLTEIPFANCSRGCQKSSNN